MNVAVQSGVAQNTGPALPRGADGLDVRLAGRKADNLLASPLPLPAVEHVHRFRLNRQQPISAEAFQYPEGHCVGTHTHPVAQLVYAISGTMGVRAAYGTLIVPPRRAVWIPAGTNHTIQILTDTAMRTVYIAKSSATALARGFCVVAVSDLLRELIVAATSLPQDYSMTGRHRNLVGLLLDEMKVLEQIPLSINDPSDRRTARIAAALRADPADDRPLEHWAAVANSSIRTVGRLFVKETGLTFSQWRQQLRLILAVEKLARGLPITVVAMDLGYATPSAFSYMFRRALGVSPRDYFHQ